MRCSAAFAIRHHALLAIALNGMTIPHAPAAGAVAGAAATWRLPPRSTFAFAALLAFYRASRRTAWPLQDDAYWLRRFARLWPAVLTDQLTRSSW